MKPDSDVAGTADATDAMSAAQFRALAELGGDIGLGIALPALELRYLSPAFAELLGFDAEALRTAMVQAEPEGPLAPLVRQLREAARMAPGERQTTELDLTDSAGRPLPFELVVSRVPGESHALVGLLRNLSARRSHQAEQKRFASMLNHEFRTPLATIDGAIQRLEATAVNADDATRQRYRKIGAAVDRLIGMLDEYLSPDRMAAIGKTRQPNTVSARELVEGAATQVRAAGREAIVEGGEPALALRGEPAGLRLALKVLVDNALAFSPPGSPIALGAAASGHGVEFAVRDQGQGVPPEDLPYIYDKGYRGANADGLPGSGLGLYMARSIVDVHGGTLNLMPGAGGADFRLWLPSVADVGKQHLASASPSSDNRTGAL